MHNRPTHAFTLIEAMILMVILTIVGLGAGVSLRAIARTPENTDEQGCISAELTRETELFRADAFAASTWPPGNTPTAWPAALGNALWPGSLPFTTSDTVSITSRNFAIVYPRSINIQYQDPNDFVNNASPQVDFVKITLTIAGQSRSVLVMQP